MSKGYLVFAQAGYIEMAELLARSIKRTQSSVNNISIVTDQPCDIELFEHVIALPTNDYALTAEWKIHNRAQSYKLTPYTETVMLDADMIFLDDVSHWWDHFFKFPMLITDKVKTYRNEWISHSPYRTTFKANQLDDCYSAFCYFKKDPFTEHFFSLLETIICNWDAWTIRYAPEHRQRIPSIDLAMAMAVKILDCKDQVFTPLDFPTFTHMKSGCQGWSFYSEVWTNHVDCKITNNGLRLGNHRQSGILHYVDKKISNELMPLF
jgi:hypothetical protein